MNTPQPTSPHRRLQELQAIPDSERTDAQWDELNDLEIQLAPGNRLDSGKQEGPRNPMARPAHARSGGQPRSGGNPNAQNSQGSQNPQNAQSRPPRPPRPEGDAQGQGAGQGPKKPFRKFHKRPAKAGTPSA